MVGIAGRRGMLNSVQRIGMVPKRLSALARRSHSRRRSWHKYLYRTDGGRPCCLRFLPDLLAEVSPFQQRFSVCNRRHDPFLPRRSDSFTHPSSIPPHHLHDINSGPDNRLLTPFLYTTNPPPSFLSKAPPRLQPPHPIPANHAP